MKNIFFPLFLLVAVLQYSACMESTDVEQLYRDQYTPQYNLTILESHLNNVTVTSAQLRMEFMYGVNIKQISVVLGTDEDSVHCGMGKTYNFQQYSSDKKHMQFTLNADSLIPGTCYYYSLVIQDYDDVLHYPLFSQFSTNELIVQLDDNHLYFNNIGENTQCGYLADYDSVFSNPSKDMAMVSEYGSRSFDIHVDTILPRQTLYIRPFIIHGGNTYYAKTVEYYQWRYSLSASVKPMYCNAKIIIYNDFNYSMIKNNVFNCGFYLSDHSISENDLGKRYDLKLDLYNETTCKVSGLQLHTTYYVRPFAEKGSKLILFDEQSFETKSGFEGDTCNIDVSYETIDDSWFLHFVRVEPGTFTMGATSVQVPYAEPDEYPAHEVTIDHPFYIAALELTEAAAYHMNVSNAYSNRNYTAAIRLTYSQSLAVIEKLKTIMGLDGFRLPTEAEWEYAARGGHKANGDWLYAGSNNYDEVGVWKTLKKAGQTIYPTYVGTKLPNALGLYDMSGGVAEWCSDLYNKDYYASSPSVNPTGPQLGDYHVVRGGDLDARLPVADRRVSNRDYCYDYYIDSLTTGLRIIYVPQE